MSIKNTELFSNLAILVKRTLPLIGEQLEAAFYVHPFKEYPEISYENDNFPSVRTYTMKADISVFFQRKNANFTPKIDLEVDDLFIAITKALTEWPEYRAYFNDNVTDQPVFLQIHAENFVKDIIIGYYYQFGLNYDSENLLVIYTPLENFILAEELNFDLAVPILFTRFDCDSFFLTENILIRKIDEATQKAKFSIRTFSPAIADPVIYSATHELVLMNYKSKKQASYYEYGTFAEPKIYPHDLIEKFFSILKLATNITSGYSQVIVHPHNWASRTKYDIKYLTGTSLRSYPTYFDDFYWTSKNFPKVSGNDLSLIARLFADVINSRENKLEIALKRFYKSMMRQEEEDIIIDIIIALEILLSDNEKSELTHKLALRITTLIAAESEESADPLITFANIKKIYDYRSAVVHGSHKANQKREIKLPDNKVIPVISLANDYLRQILMILIPNPKYLSAKEIDNMMLLNQHKNKTTGKKQ